MEALRITAVIFAAALSLVRGKDDPSDTTAVHYTCSYLSLVILQLVAMIGMQNI